jgi:tetratricopeptide (TPR) repeat protein
MNNTLAQQAIDCAMNGNWSEAIKLNQKILSSTPLDLDALNRLARAYAELGEMDKAKISSAKVLKIDPFNSIATKALARWKTVKKGEIGRSITANPSTFLEEPGKTKIISLLHVGCPEIIAKIDTGDKVQLDCHCHRVAVATMDGKYIGKLPDDLSLKIKNLVNRGYEYESTIISVDNSEVKVFVKEIKKGPNMGDVVSFPIEKIEYSASTRADLSNGNRGDTTSEEE